MRLNFSKILCAAFAAALVGCAEAPEIHIVPNPESLVKGEGVFKIAGAPIVAGEGLDDESAVVANTFAQHLTLVTGKKSEVVSSAAGKAVEFALNPELASEEYKLDVTKQGVRIEAASSAGFRYATQSIGQMLPAEYFGKVAAAEAKWILPVVSIQDKPRFAYRGMHLDVGRHIFSVDEVKKYLDVMAAYKLNRLHWHLTEDQGWRIEIKKYPKLTEIGAYRDRTMVDKNWDEFDNTRYGGFYTQEQIKEVVDYASSLGITVIPEIDLPGHMVAALASYPELGCTGGPYEVRQIWGVADEVLCPGKEITFQFLEDVLDEVMALFPSEYIHIGGDECPKVFWEKCPDCQKRIKALGLKSDKRHTAEQYLQSYVTARIQKYLNDHGRKIIGWDEILEGELAPGATVMSWRGAAGGIEAAKNGFDVIMTPNTYMYFDYYQSKHTDIEPVAIGGYLPVENVYQCNPTEGIPESAQKHILGVQANLWTEYIATDEYLEYMLLPRMAALSEVQWCSLENKDYDRFKASLNHAFDIYDVMGLNYCKAVFGEYGMDYVKVEEQPAEEKAE
ncbi:MAG: beta-N-acetylhexosaminidase [Candidatus Cryptobacteroides sp.]